MRFFFYGTLLDGDVRRLVLGERAPTLVEPARLDGWRRMTLEGVDYPVIVPAVGGVVEGAVARGLDATGHARLVRYEGPDYVLAEVEVRLDAGSRGLAVNVFVPRPGFRVIGRPGWDLVRWQRRVKPRFLARLRPGHTAASASRSTT